MNFKQSFLLAVKSILSSKVRSILTMLGIIIGVAAVIIIVSMGNGMTAEMEDAFASLGTNLITVNLRGRGSSRTVTVDDMYELLEKNPDLLSAVTPLVTTSVTLKNGTDSVTTTANGVSEDYAKIKNYSVENGRFIQYIDVLRRQKVCVIGTYIQKELFGGNAVGNTVKLNGEPYVIVGVLEERSSSEEGGSDDIVIIPYTNASKISWARSISTYNFSATDRTVTSQAKSVIETALYKVYEDEDVYTVTDMAETLEDITSLTDTLVLVLAAIAAISLIVGGIGIMNIMLVSVTERTREIGIRKSLGAKKKDIMRQFVIEAATTSSVGGVIGIFLGVGLAYAAGNLLGMAAKPSIGAIMVAFLVSLGIGVSFGFLPANKAAKLNPIDALRYD